MLPWAPDAVLGTVTNPVEATYLDDLRSLIAARVATLPREINDCVLAGTPPAWTRSVVTPFARYEHSRPGWLDQVQVVAALREQYPSALINRGASGAPDADVAQPLGPYPEPAPHTDRAHARAHAVAALALVRAFDIAHPDGTRHHQAGAHDARNETPQARAAETRRQLTTAVWAALEPGHRTAVAAALLARIGTLLSPATNATTPSDTSGPAGSETSADAGPPAVSGLDEVVTHPVLADDLHRILVERGHLTDLDSPPRHEPTGSPTRQPTRRSTRWQPQSGGHPPSSRTRAAGHRPEPPLRPAARSSGARPEPLVPPVNTTSRVSGPGAEDRRRRRASAR